MSNKEVTEVFKANIKRAEEAIAALATLVETRKSKLSDSTDWGDVGDAGRLAIALEAVVETQTNWSDKLTAPELTVWHYMCGGDWEAAVQEAFAEDGNLDQTASDIKHEALIEHETTLDLNGIRGLLVKLHATA